MPGGREPVWESSVREARDSELPMPKLILHALQVNSRGGHLPETEVNGKRYSRSRWMPWRGRLGVVAGAWPARLIALEAGGVFLRTGEWCRIYQNNLSL